MDYGSEWETAWEEHVKTWKPPPQSEQYVHSTEFGSGNDFVFRTEAELKENPYPPNLITMCESVENYNVWEYCKVKSPDDGDNGKAHQAPTYTVENHYLEEEREVTR